MKKTPNISSPTKRQLTVIFFLTTTLFVGSVIKVGLDYHWWVPETEIVSYLGPDEIKVKLDINKAPWYELVLLPKVGEAKAKAIVAYRELHGNFRSVEDLSQVKGVGQSIIDAIRDYVIVGPMNEESK